jgi:hypothetical protein
METTFVKWLKATTTKNGKFSRGEISELPSDEAAVFIGRGYCKIPELCKVVYKGEQSKKEYTLSWRKLSITFIKNQPKLVPSAIAKRHLQFPSFEITKP